MRSHLSWFTFLWLLGNMKVRHKKPRQCSVPAHVTWATHINWDIKLPGVSLIWHTHCCHSLNDYGKQLSVHVVPVTVSSRQPRVLHHPLPIRQASACTICLTRLYKHMSYVQFLYMITLLSHVAQTCRSRPRHIKTKSHFLRLNHKKWQMAVR